MGQWAAHHRPPSAFQELSARRIQLVKDAHLRAEHQAGDMPRRSSRRAGFASQ